MKRLWRWLCGLFWKPVVDTRRRIQVYRRVDRGTKLIVDTVFPVRWNKKSVIVQFLNGDIIKRHKRDIIHYQDRLYTNGVIPRGENDSIPQSENLILHKRDIVHA